jgi:lon-related putative ATP-dependent protease
MEQLIEDLGAAIPAAFESEDFRSRTEALKEEFQDRRIAPLNELREEAKEQGIMLIETPGGFAFAPMNPQSEVLSPEEFNKLPEEERSRIEKVVGALQEKLQGILRQVPAWRNETKEKVKLMSQEIARFAVGHFIEAVKERYADRQEILGYLDQVQQDIIEHVDQFRSPSDDSQTRFGMAAHGDPFQRYKINLLVNHSKQQAAPVIHENLPSHANLIGRCEYQAQMGTLVTDFTFIKPGALHEANGGYLILDARKVLLQPYAWDTLKRTLQSREIRIESLERTLSLISTSALEPEPIPLDIKVILVGDRLLYYLLNQFDPEFRDLFKVAADFDDRMHRSPETNQLYARMIATLARRRGLRALDRSAVMRVIEHSARLAEDAERLSTHLRSITDVLQEADYWAGQSGHETISRSEVQEAIDKQVYRADRVRERIYEEIRRGTMLIDTSGEALAQVNGLSVIQLGEFSFGRPSRITATTHLGEGEVIDIERESDLGGAIHSKGVLILSSFLASRYAKRHPLSMTASLVFEQSYAEVEGDSASLAELCALLSELAKLPIRQSLGVTGSVNQHGVVQPIGGVNEKIEGFFDVCQSFGLTGQQGVLIPSRNVKHLMLRDDVIQAVQQGKFSVYAMDTVDQALELLTGYPAGERDGNGKYPQDSVNGRAEKQLLEFAAIRRSFAAESRERAENVP